MASMSWHLRKATAADSAAIAELIARSIRSLGTADYSSQQIEGALRGAFGLDSQLVADGTYFVVESDGRLVGCGGWSYRRTLFGGDARAGRDTATLDPGTDAARIRAFFVDPAVARQGIGSALLAHCEAEARRHGFRRAEMMATLPGVRLYAARGYAAGERIRYPLAVGLAIEFVPMAKPLTAPAG